MMEEDRKSYNDLPFPINILSERSRILCKSNKFPTIKMYFENNDLSEKFNDGFQENRENAFLRCTCQMTAEHPSNDLSLQFDRTIYSALTQQNCSQFSLHATEEETFIQWRNTATIKNRAERNGYITVGNITMVTIAADADLCTPGVDSFTGVPIMLDSVESINMQADLDLDYAHDLHPDATEDRHGDKVDLKSKEEEDYIHVLHVHCSSYIALKPTTTTRNCEQTGRSDSEDVGIGALVGAVFGSLIAGVILGVALYHVIMILKSRRKKGASNKRQDVNQMDNPQYTSSLATAPPYVIGGGGAIVASPPAGEGKAPIRLEPPMTPTRRSKQSRSTLRAGQETYEYIDIVDCVKTVDGNYSDDVKLSTHVMGDVTESQTGSGINSVFLEPEIELEDNELYERGQVDDLQKVKDSDMKDTAEVDTYFEDNPAYEKD